MRDTDADWRAIADIEPHYGVLSNDRFLAGNLDAEAMEAFYAAGEADVSFINGEIRRRWPDFGPARAIDFGCGVGRLSLAMLAYVPEVIGVDVAPAMLRLAAARAEAVGARLSLTSEIPAEADWVMSHIVFQHIPPSRGLALLDRLLSVLPVGGFASLQFALHRSPERVAGLDARWVRQGDHDAAILAQNIDPAIGMRMYDYDAGAILARYFDAGLVDPVIYQTVHGGHIGAWFIGRRHV